MCFFSFALRSFFSVSLGSAFYPYALCLTFFVTRLLLMTNIWLSSFPLFHFCVFWFLHTFQPMVFLFLCELCLTFFLFLLFLQHKSYFFLYKSLNKKRRHPTVFDCIFCFF